MVFKCNINTPPPTQIIKVTVDPFLSYNNSLIYTYIYRGSSVVISHAKTLEMDLRVFVCVCVLVNFFVNLTQAKAIKNWNLN